MNEKDLKSLVTVRALRVQKPRIRHLIDATEFSNGSTKKATEFSNFIEKKRRERDLNPRGPHGPQAM